MTWLTVQETASLCGVSHSTIWKAVKQNRVQASYVNGIGRGGKQLRILLESLPQEAQDRYHGQAEQETADIRLLLTDEQRAQLDHKQAVVLSYRNFKATYSKADKLQAFLQQYNDQHPEEPLTKRQLEYWSSRYDQDGLSGLVDKRGTWNKGVSSIPEDVWQVFCAYWLHEKGNSRSGGPSVASCYRLTQLNFPDRQLPSISAFERRARAIPYPVQVYTREGKKAYGDKCEPYIQFDYRSICTNEVWCADNHIFDLWVKDGTGRIFRPWIVGWIDKRSRLIVGYLLLDHDPNSNDILDAFARSVSACGIPERVLLDNGADYKAADLFNRDFALSMANEMRIAVTNAIPYNAKAKLIERFFNTLEYEFCIHLPSYFGADPKRRPDSMKKAENQLREKAMPFKEFSDFICGIINHYNHTAHSGDAMDGKTPMQAFKDFVERPIRKASPELLAMYFKRTTRALTVGRNGVRVPELGLYFDDDRLFPYQKQKVYARYNTDDIRQVYIFDEDGTFICTAASRELGTLNQEVTAQNMRELNRKKQEYRKAVKQYLPDIRVPSIQELAISFGLSFSKPDLKSLPTADTLHPEKMQQAQAIQNEERRQDEQRKEAGKQAASNGISRAESLKLMTQYMKEASGGI